MRPKGTPEELESRRRRALDLLKEGRTEREIAEIVGASNGSVHRWKKAWEEGGDDALDPVKHTGPTPRLDEKQLKKLGRILLKGAVAYGYPTELWTLQRVAEVIEEEFGESYHPSGVWKVLGRMGWSCQKPERRARERNEDDIRTWRVERWPELKKSARRRS
jgi:transposase